MRDKKACTRTSVFTPIARPSEALSGYFIGHSNPVDPGDLRLPLPGASPPPPIDEWTPAQRDHVVVQAALKAGAHPSRVRRLGIFMDDAGFTKQESFEGLFISDLDTGMRFLIAIIRKAELCDCGCRGFCTFWPVHDAILSDLQSSADGKWSVVSHLQEAFEPGSKRQQRAGMPMGLVLAITELRADMPGYTGPMGFRASSHVHHPCSVCNISKADLSNLDNISLDDGPSDLFTNAQYQALKSDCSVVVTIRDIHDVSAILYDGGLEYDHRKTNGFLGRRLLNPVTLTLADGSKQELHAGDRLHPTRTLRDVADFETRSRPFQCLFWRVGDMKTARLLHHSPLMDIPGVGMQTYAIDVLHTWHLGGIPRYVAKVFWLVLRSNALADGFPMWYTSDDRMHLKLLRLRSALWVHYKQMQVADPTWKK
jgi:hypothetical protein